MNGGTRDFPDHSWDKMICMSISTFIRNCKMKAKTLGDLGFFSMVIVHGNRRVLGDKVSPCPKETICSKGK